MISRGLPQDRYIQSIFSFRKTNQTNQININVLIKMAKKFSGLQKQVLGLYRKCIRNSYLKPIENRSHFIQYSRNEFAKYHDLPRKEFSTIEHLLRVGNRKLEMLKSGNVKDINH